MSLWEMFIVGVIGLVIGFALVVAILDEIYSCADRREVARYTLELNMAAARTHK